MVRALSSSRPPSSALTRQFRPKCPRFTFDGVAMESWSRPPCLSGRLPRLLSDWLAQSCRGTSFSSTAIGRRQIAIFEARTDDLRDGPDGLATSDVVDLPASAANLSLGRYLAAWRWIDRQASGSCTPPTFTPEPLVRWSCQTCTVTQRL